MTKKPITLRYVVTATLLGNTLEWYDYVSFAFLSSIFSRIFFPHENIWASLDFTLFGLATGALLRPIGGIIFGFIGDRFGRRIAILVSILFITVPTFLIGLIPSYSYIGIAAPILLIIMRLLQGIAIGGELPGAITLIDEYSSPQQRPFYGSFVIWGILFGSFLGALDFILLYTHFSLESFQNWGWRLTFFIGAIIGTVAYFFRKKLHETSVFQELRHSHEILKDPLKELFLRHKKGIAKGFGITFLQGISYNLMLSFSMLYYVEILHYSLWESMKMTLLYLLLMVIIIPIAGHVSGRIGPKRQCIWFAWGLLLFSLPLYALLEDERLRFLTPICFALLTGFYMAPFSALMANLFPTKVRFSGIAFGLNIAIALSGVSTPLLALSLVHYTNLIWSPGLIFMIGSIVSLITLRTLKA